MHANARVTGVDGPRRGRGPLRRLVIDNDFAGDPDGLLALAHHLLSSDRVDAVTSSLTSPMFPGSATGAARGAALAAELIAVCNPAQRPTVATGSERPGEASEASRTIVEHARRDDPLPLAIVCAGPLTNIAAALADDPGIASRARLVWVGGSLDGAFEYNQDTDAAAAEALFVSDMPIEQYPLETYRRTAVSLAELQVALAGSRVGRAVWRAFEAIEIPSEFPVGELWHLGDSLPLLATSLAAPPTDDVPHRVIHHEADIRLLLADFLAKCTLANS